MVAQPEAVRVEYRVHVTTRGDGVFTVLCSSMYRLFPKTPGEREMVGIYKKTEISRVIRVTGFWSQWGDLSGDTSLGTRTLRETRVTGVGENVVLLVHSREPG